jgi:hypothetical protein
MTVEEQDAYDDFLAEVKTWATCEACGTAINPDFGHTEQQCLDWEKQMEELRYEGYANDNPHTEGLEPVWDRGVGAGRYQVGQEIASLIDYVNDTCTCAGFERVGNCDHIDFARMYRMEHAEEESGWVKGETVLWKKPPKGVSTAGSEPVEATIEKVFASITGLPLRLRIWCRGFAYAVGEEELEHIEVREE